MNLECTEANNLLREIEIAQSPEERDRALSRLFLWVIDYRREFFPVIEVINGRVCIKKFADSAIFDKKSV